jgi:hypothetical protein
MQFGKVFRFLMHVFEALRCKISLLVYDEL